MNTKGLINKDELIKSLTDLEFSVEDINEIVEKAEKEGKLAPADDNVVKEGAEYEAAEKEKTDKEEVKKAFDKIMSMKDELDKSIADFTCKYGEMPGFEKPKTEPVVVTEKAETDELEKAEKDAFEKALGGRFEVIEKAFEDRFTAQQKINEELLKSLSGIQSTVQQIAETPNPLKGLFGSYGNAIIEKGGKSNEDGQTVYSLRDKKSVIGVFEKSIDKISNEADRQIVNNMISSYTISGLTNDTGLDIVKKALNVDFEK